MRSFYLNHPYWAWTVTVAVIGAVIGYLVVGNLGIVARGHGVGVWGWLLGSGVGAYIGFRIGEWRHRRSSIVSPPPGR